MVNPVLTILFDIAVIGGTVALFAAAIAEARMQRRGAVPAAQAFRRRPVTRTPARLKSRTARPRVRIAA